MLKLKNLIFEQEVVDRRKLKRAKIALIRSEEEMRDSLGRIKKYLKEYPHTKDASKALDKSYKKNVTAYMREALKILRGVK
jgi:hypothetical protein